MTVDRELLFKPRLPEADVDVPGLGTVRVRALSRAEVMRVRSEIKSIPDALKRQAELERQMIALAMVDPALTVDEVRRWQEASPAGELEVVTDKIQEISGMLEGAAKAAYKEFDADPASEFRLPPGGQARDDGGRDAGPDEQ